MRSKAVCAALVVAALAAGSVRPAAGQALASLAAVSAGVTTTAVKPASGCWGCAQAEVVSWCEGGFNPGYWNCSSSSGYCSVSSPGCGGGAMLPLDPDGATQYVSRGARIGVEAELLDRGLAVRRNCDGVIVARHQSPENIATVRTLTGSLTL